MKWFLLVVVATAIVFYARFLFAMQNELKHHRRKSERRPRKPVVRTDLFRMDMADLWAIKPQIEVQSTEEEF